MFLVDAPPFDDMLLVDVPLAGMPLVGLPLAGVGFSDDMSVVQREKEGR
jgi:hypothetical protein